MLGAGAVLVGDNCPKAVAGLCGGGTIRAVRAGLTICLPGDCVCDRCGGINPCCFVGSMPLGGDRVLAAA